MNCCVFPAVTVGFTGVTAMDTSVAAVTVSVVLPEMAPLVALMVVPPAFSADAKPEPLIVAVTVLDDAHVTLAVMFCVELSLYVPVAVNCCVFPATTDGFTGVTAIDTSVAAVTVNPFTSVTTSAPVAIVTLLAPSAAVPAMFTTAVALVAEVTVSEPTLIPAPAKLIVVTPCEKCVPTPLIFTERFCCPRAPLAGLIPALAAVTCTCEHVVLANATPPVVVPLTDK